MVGKRGAPDWLLVMGELRLAAVWLDDGNGDPFRILCEANRERY